MRLARLGWPVVAVLWLWHPPAATASPPLSSVDALSPGVGIASFDAALTDGDTCTAGFLVRDHSRVVGLLAAAHCNRGGTVAIKLSGTDYTRIGTFNGGLDRGDIGFVSLMPGVPVNASVVDMEPVRGVTDHVTMGQVLCKEGLATGRQCGPVTAFTAGTVTFAATTQCGDSGGPVYATNPDGTVTALGMTSAGTMGEGTVAPPCGTALPFAIAQLIQPWLSGSAMTVLTS